MKGEMNAHCVDETIDSRLKTLPRSLICSYLSFFFLSLYRAWFEFEIVFGRWMAFAQCANIRWICRPLQPFESLVRMEKSCWPNGVSSHTYSMYSLTLSVVCESVAKGFPKNFSMSAFSLCLRMFDFWLAWNLMIWCGHSRNSVLSFSSFGVVGDLVLLNCSGSYSFFRSFIRSFTRSPSFPRCVFVSIFFPKHSYGNRCVLVVVVVHLSSIDDYRIDDKPSVQLSAERRAATYVSPASCPSSNHRIHHNNIVRQI